MGPPGGGEGGGWGPARAGGGGGAWSGAGGCAEGSAAVGDGEGASVVVVGASLAPDEDGGCDGAPSEAEEDSPPRVGATELLLPPGPVDGPTATSSDLPDVQGVAELAAAIPS